ncbi:MAG: secretin N-terminal domain-containing protein [Acidobacteriota bacterium]
MRSRSRRPRSSFVSRELIGAALVAGALIVAAPARADRDQVRITSQTFHLKHQLASDVRRLLTESSDVITQSMHADDEANTLVISGYRRDLCKAEGFIALIDQPVSWWLELVARGESHEQVLRRQRLDWESLETSLGDRERDDDWIVYSLNVSHRSRARVVAKYRVAARLQPSRERSLSFAESGRETFSDGGELVLMATGHQVHQAELAALLGVGFDVGEVLLRAVREGETP